MYHFFARQENIFDDYILIDGADVNHLKNVLRVKTGEKILMSSGDNTDYYCTISEIRDNEIIAEIEKVDEEGRELSSKIYLFQGLPKGDKMELIIQKAVELGVYEVVPVAMKRSVVKLDDRKAEGKVKRWNAIAESAAKQSKRSIIPAVKDVMTFEKAAEYAKQLDMVLLPYECAKGMQATKKIINSIKKGQSIGIFIGPEGGFDGSELTVADDNEFNVITLGRRILRTETAGMMVLSVLMYHLEE